MSNPNNEPLRLRDLPQQELRDCIAEFLGVDFVSPVCDSEDIAPAQYCPARRSSNEPKIVAALLEQDKEIEETEAQN